MNRSLLTAVHFAQLHFARKFQMFDYGARTNFRVYGQRTPINIGDQFFRLAGLPVDLIAGTRDGVIPSDNVKVGGKERAKSESDRRGEY